MGDLNYNLFQYSVMLTTNTILSKPVHISFGLTALSIILNSFYLFLLSLLQCTMGLSMRCIALEFSQTKGILGTIIIFLKQPT